MKLFLPALQGSFGDWMYYSALMQASDVAERVKYAREIQTNDKLSDLIQRALDDKKRGSEIASYLQSNESRFFNSLVIGVQGGAPEWHPFGLTAIADHSLNEVVDRDQDLVGYLELSGEETLFALDGQHRLSGIRIAMEQGLDIAEERLSVIFVPHFRTKEGLRRTRSLFISLNKRVVPVKRRDIIALDEVDLSAIITRQLVDDHPWFSKGQIDFERFTNSLPAKSPCWTTIGNLYDLIKIIVSSIAECRDADELKAADRNRLADDRINAYKDDVVSFFERLAALDPALRKIFNGKKVAETSQEARSRETPRTLFRPVGAKIIVRIAADARKSGASMNQTSAILKHAPMMLNETPFAGILWDEERGRMVSTGASLSYRLLAYMLGVKDADAKLRNSYAEWQGLGPNEPVRLPKRLIRK